MKILIQKVNSGIVASPVKAGKIGPKTLSAMYRALEMYKNEVSKAFAAAGLSGIGYHEDFERARVRQEYGKNLVMDLEPWGFAGGTLEEPVMGDTGSAPTNTRAKVLLCYQAPLEKIAVDEYRVKFERVYELD
jgi:hypothetical protein